MQWGLPKDVLRDTWNLVAGNHGQLDARQFISCVYLMDMVKKVLVHVLYAMCGSVILPSPTRIFPVQGCKLPEVLPSTNFPPFVFRGGTDVAVSDIMVRTIVWRLASLTSNMADFHFTYQNIKQAIWHCCCAGRTCRF